MPKLNQIIAVTSGKKTRTVKQINEITGKLEKSALLSGLSRTYQPRDEEGERMPSEKNMVQYTVVQALKDIRKSLSELFNLVATQEYANCEAKADVIVDDKVILKQVPVSYLLFLEKQLIELNTIVSRFPTLDPSESWIFNDDVNCYSSEMKETTRTKKLPRNHIKYDATKEHPAQVEVYYEDIIVGYWNTLKFSGAITAVEKNEMLDRIKKLQNAVKFAREEANSMEVAKKKVDETILNYIFGV